MAVNKPKRISPWLGGIDNFHSANHSVFQVEGNKAIRLRAAENINIDNTGRAFRRLGLTSWNTISTAGLNVFSGAGMLLLQDGGSILRVTGINTASSLVTGLSSSARIHFHEHAGQIYWTNGVVTGRILSDGTAKNWGCSTAPAPTLGTTTGDLRAGKYLVAATFLDSSGIEHSADQAAVITVDGTKDITVALSAVDSNAAYVRIYASRTNGQALFWCKTVAANALPTTITSVDVSEEPLRTQFFSPPIPGDGLFSYRGMMMIYADQYIFPSYGANTHLYEISDIIEARPGNVIGGVGLNTGFWTTTANGAFWTQGATPDEWQTWQRDSRAYASGGTTVPGYFFPMLETSESVALFASEDGLMAGMPNGQLLPMTYERLRLDVDGKRADFSIGVANGLRQLIFTLK